MPYCDVPAAIASRILDSFFLVQDVIADERRRDEDLDRRDPAVALGRFHQTLRDDRFEKPGKLDP